MTLVESYVDTFIGGSFVIHSYFLGTGATQYPIASHWPLGVLYHQGQLGPTSGHGQVITCHSFVWR